MKKSIPKEAFLVCFRRITKLLKLRVKYFFTASKYQMKKQRLIIHVYYLRVSINSIFL
jgi:hypothetical protein